MKEILAVLALVVVLAACHENYQSTEVKTDSTTIFVGTIPFVEAGANDTVCGADENTDCRAHEKGE